MPSPEAPDSLQVVAVETERFVAGAGWDQPPRLFALVPTRELTEAAPHLGLAESESAAEADLSAVEQEGFEAPDLQRALAGIAWPDAVAGVALAVERAVVPPEAEQDLPGDPDAALAALAAHPGRRDVRILAAVHRDGRSTCVLRQRAYDSDDMVATGRDIAAGLLGALAGTLRD